MMFERQNYLFVYGTLRSGLNTAVKKLIAKDVERMGESEIPGRLYDIGEYPGALPVTNKKAVLSGEKYLESGMQKSFANLGSI